MNLILLVQFWASVLFSIFLISFLVCQKLYEQTNSTWCENDGVCYPDINSPDIPKCKCPPGTSGTRCELKSCPFVSTLYPYGCSSAGTCDTSSGRCNCIDGRFGDDCSSKFQLFKCILVL